MYNFVIPCSVVGENLMVADRIDHKFLAFVEMLCRHIGLPLDGHTGQLNPIYTSNPYIDVIHIIRATSVAQWLRCCATNRQVAGSIPDGISGVSH